MNNLVCIKDLEWEIKVVNWSIYWLVWQRFDYLTINHSLVTYITPILETIISNSYIFQWLSPNILINGLSMWFIRIERISEWELIIKENDENCGNFFVLLDGDLWVFKWNKKISQLKQMEVFGEIWFLDPKMRRTASVKSLSEWVIMTLNQDFINYLDLPIRLIISHNFNKELTRKLLAMNKIVSGLWSWHLTVEQISDMLMWISADLIQTIK